MLAMRLLNHVAVCVCVCLDNKSSLLYFHLDKTDTVLYSPELDKYVLLWCEIKQQNVSMSKSGDCLCRMKNAACLVVNV